MNTGRFISDFLDGLAPGHAGRFLIRDGDLYIAEVPPATIRGFLAYPGMIGTLSDTMRPGANYFARYLELVHFPPGSPREPLLVAMMLPWHGIMWSIHSVPRRWIDADGYPWRGEAMLRDAARVARLRVVAAGWKPVLAMGGGVPLDAATRPVGDASLFGMGFAELDFPMGNLMYLENEPGHLVYRDPLGARAQEEEDIRLLEGRMKARQV